MWKEHSRAIRKDGGREMPWMKNLSPVNIPLMVRMVGTTVDRPSSLFELGEWLFNYDPIVAENIFWAGTFGKELEHKLKDSDWAGSV